MPGAVGSHVCPPILWGKGGENGSEFVDDLLLTPHHQTIAELEAPNPAAGPGVYVVQTNLLQRGATPHIIMKVRVAAINDNVLRFQERSDRVDRTFRRRA